MGKQLKGKKQQPAAQAKKKAVSGPFLLQREQYAELFLFTCAAVVVYLLMRYLYPTPAACADTFHYINAAIPRQIGVYRPYGYSALLIWMKSISASTHIVFLLQYLFHFLSALFFIYTLKYLFRPRNVSERLLFICFSICTLFSPAVLYLSNYVISDSVFISLTLLWVTTLIWILHNRNLFFAFLHFVLLFLIIKVRYTGLFYPVFSAAAIIFVFRKKIQVLLALIPFLVLGYIYLSTVRQMNAIYKTSIFSAFSGWQLANNALHIKPYISLNPDNIRDPEIRKIHMAALETSDSVCRAAGITDTYMWDSKRTLKKYLLRYIEDHNTVYLIAWARVSIPMRKYGQLLIIKYPFLYFRHFLLPNARLVFLPKWTEMLAYSEHIKDKDSQWFVYDADDDKKPKHDLFKQYYFPVLPVLTLILWLLLGACLAYFAYRFKRYRLNKVQQAVFFFMLAFLAAYIMFHVLAAPVVVRYMLGIHAIQVALIYIVILLLMQQRTGKDGSL